MILSLSRKFLFVHVYKVAGTSIARALSSFDFRRELQPAQTRTAELYLSSSGINPRAIWMHDHALAVEVRDMMRPAVFNALYKVGFVRNPWDLQLSLYKYNLKHPRYRNAKRDFRSFERFIMSAPEGEYPLGQQKRFLFDERGRQLVDFVGRYEHLDEDFGKMCEAVGLEHVKLEHHNATSQTHWPSHYTREMFEKVRRSVAPDIEAFGYSDDPAPYAIH